MNHILIDLRACLRLFYRNKSAVFWTVAFPMVLMLLFGAIWSQSSQRNDLYIQNQDTVDGKATYWSEFFVNVLNGTDAFNIKWVDAAENATDYALKNRLSSVLIIPVGFNESANLALMTQGAQSANVTFVYDKSNTASPIVQTIVMGIVEKLNFNFSNGKNYLTVSDLTIAPERFSQIDYMLPGVIAMTAMTTSVFSSVSTSARFKENGVFHKLSTTPLKRYEWILSRTLFNVFVSYLGMAVLLVVGVFLFNVKISLDAVTILMVAMVSLLFTGVGMAIARFVRDPEGADAAANVITFPMMFLSGTFFQLSWMPPFLQSVAQVLPLTYANEGLRAALIFGQSGTAIVNTVIISVMGVIAIVVGSLITKWEDD